MPTSKFSSLGLLLAKSSEFVFVKCVKSATVRLFK